MKHYTRFFFGGDYTLAFINKLLMFSFLFITLSRNRKCQIENEYKNKIIIPTSNIT